MQSTSDALETLSDLLTSLTESPYSLELYSKYLQLVSVPELADQFEGAVELLTQFHAATDDVWLPFLQSKLRQLGISDDFESMEDVSLDLSSVTLDALLDLFELFRKAESDYFSIPFLKKEIETLILLHSFSATNPALRDLLDEEAVRQAIAVAVLHGSWHITQGQALWDLQITWEKARLEEKDPGSPERTILQNHIANLHLERLGQPHSANEQTLQSYSSFVSTHYGPEEYESRLVFATKRRTGPAKAWGFKERYENSLGSSPTREDYQNYLTSEERVKIPNVMLINTLYERAIADFAKRRWSALLNNSDSLILQELEDTLRYFWCNYIDFSRAGGDKKLQILLAFRASRSVPGCGEVWAKYMRNVERYENSEREENETNDEEKMLETVPSVYIKALSTSLLQKNVQEFIPVVLAMASYENRKVADETGLQTLVELVEDAISTIRRASKEGDPQLTLETFLSGVLMRRGLSSNALKLWESTVKYYKNSYVAWSRYLDLLISENDEKTRIIFSEASAKNLDWPEAIWAKWKDYVHVHGSLDDIELCLDKVKVFSVRLASKRAREAAKAQQAWLNASHSATEAQVTISAPVEVAEPMAVDSLEGTNTSDRKRKAEGSDETEMASKRIKLDEKENLKRDRENSTVFVSALPPETTEDELVSLFKDCGNIREVKITQLNNSLVATVEFMDRESIPAALTKDKKRIRGHEIAVHLAWKSTLYVTNFPEDTDDAKIRELFGTFGEIFEVRWPSKKYKSTRRFCYIQYTSPAAAMGALSLHGRELEPERQLTVYVSDPQRKQGRTDASANDREIHVAGLARSVKEIDLKKIFEVFGAIKDIRMPLDEKGSARGFAFVEFTEAASASAALAANNQELKKRRISVTLADTRGALRQRDPSRRTRTVRIKNLIPDTQEGLLQQLLEKHADVVRVEVFNKKHEAVVELSSAVEAGKLLLKPEPIIFGDQPLKFIEEDLPASSRESVQSALAFPPRAGRPRAGIGSKKNLNKGANMVAVKASASTSRGDVGAGEKGQDDFRRMLGGI